MLFNDPIFIFIFLPTTFFIYFYLNHKRLTVASKGFLVVSSLFFYSWWNVIYLPIIVVSLIFNFIIGQMLGKKPRTKILLILGVVANLALLGYFKYSDFFIENFNLAFNSSIGLLHLTLPLAISFFTFQQIAYLVDSYRQEVKESDFLNYAVFVTFFPQLIAGPIVHHKEMMPQFKNQRAKIINPKNIATGLFIFSVGLFKKVIIADTFAVWASKGFDVAPVLSFFEAWATSLSYTFQLYFDFSGYTDMAIGIALMFNIRLPINFNSPYKALNIQDFWRRWHITLSRFLKDYIYIPLGGNRKGDFRTYNNLFLTFLLGGIWHGAGWTFLFWGVLHGGALVVHRFWSGFNFQMKTWIAWFITFNFINISWVFFRAKEWEDAIKVLSGMVGLNGVVLNKCYEECLSFLRPFEIFSFDDFSLNIHSGMEVFIWLCLGFLIISKNNINGFIEGKKRLKYYHSIFISFSFMLYYFTTIEVRQSPFLYFNF